MTLPRFHPPQLQSAKCNPRDNTRREGLGFDLRCCGSHCSVSLILLWYKDSVLPEKLRGMNTRFWAAMASYAVLAIIAIFALDGFLRSVVLFFFAILAVKTIAHSKDEEMK